MMRSNSYLHHLWNAYQTHVCFWDNSVGTLALGTPFNSSSCWKMLIISLLQVFCSTQRESIWNSAKKHSLERWLPWSMGVTQHCPSYGNERFHKKWTVFQLWEGQWPKIKEKQSNPSLKAKSKIPYFFTSFLSSFIFTRKYFHQRDSMHHKALTLAGSSSEHLYIDQNLFKLKSTL